MLPPPPDHAVLSHDDRRGGPRGMERQHRGSWAGLGQRLPPCRLPPWQASQLPCLCGWQVKDLASVSLKNPVRIFVNSNTDVAPFLRQEFVRIRPNREGDREAIVAGVSSGRAGCSAPLSFTPKVWFLPRHQLLHPVSPSAMPGPAVCAVLLPGVLPLSLSSPRLSSATQPSSCPAEPLDTSSGGPSGSSPRPLHRLLACCSSLLPGRPLPPCLFSTLLIIKEGHLQTSIHPCSFANEPLCHLPLLLD